jgi:hypothetical protein
VTRQDGNTVEMTGPVVLEVPDAALVLNAGGKITGHDDPVAKSGRLEASGDVVLDYGANKLRSDALLLAWQLVAGIPVVLVSTTGVTTLDAVASDGRKGTTIARGGLGGTATKKKLTITEARDVEITSAEEGGLSAKAKLVRDFDPDARTFAAQGDVTFSSTQGTGSAERVVAESREDLHLFGSAGKRAQLDFNRGPVGRTPAVVGHVEANEILATPVRVTASGHVTGVLTSENARLDFDSELLDLEASPENPLDPAAPRTFRAHVEKAVTANIVRGTERAHVRSDDLVVEGSFTAGERPTVVLDKVHAKDAVHVDYAGRGELVGDGD